MKVTPCGVLVTRVTQPRAEWLTARRTGITATDVVALAGLDPYRSAHDVWLDKRGRPDDEPGEAAHWGSLLEGPVAEEWAHRTGAKIRRVGLLRHHQHGHHMATCDRLVVGGRHEVLEVKVRSAFVAAQWESGVPDKVVAQVQWQLHVTGLETAHVAALIGGQRLATFEVARDQDIINYLSDLADEAWSQTSSDTPPVLEPQNLRPGSLRRLWPDRGGVVQVDPTAAGELVAAYRRVSAEASAAEKARQQAQLALQQMLGDADTACVGDVEMFSHRRSRDVWRVPDSQRLVDVLPEAVAAGLIVKQPGTRRLHIPKERSK